MLSAALRGTGRVFGAVALRGGRSDVSLTVSLELEVLGEKHRRGGVPLSLHYMQGTCCHQDVAWVKP